MEILKNRQTILENKELIDLISNIVHVLVKW